MPKKSGLSFFLFSFITILTLFSNISFAYDYLYVQDPRNTWKYGQGTIEEAVISIKPMGLYMEYGVYLTFSARGTYNISPSDTVEVQYYFDLPKDAIVHDLWLWVDKDIIRANILDTWTASSIYENIVKRRRDPAILFKRSQTSYEMRIFPMAASQTRRIKLTYLVPCQWLPSMVTSPLPMNILKVSLNTPKVKIIYWPDANWKNPRLIEYPGSNFITGTDAQYPQYCTVNVPSNAINTGVNFAADSPMSNGIYLSKFGSSSEGIYQLAYLPSEALNIKVSKKAAIILDYSPGKTNISYNELITNLKAAVRANFSARDSFNLIYSQQLAIKRASSKWISADSVQVEKYFSELLSNPVSTYSSLPSLLNDGITFIKENGNDASILLISDSDQNGEYTVANSLIGDLLKIMKPYLPINIVDYQNQSYNYYYIGNRSYYGNEYFFDNISRMTNGIYKNIRSGGQKLADMFNSSIQTLGGFVNSFDLYTTVQDGYCFGRFNVTPIEPTVYLNKPILQIGKYKGNFPFTVQVSGDFKSQTFTNKTVLQQATSTSADSLLDEVWAGNYIKSLESMTLNNSLVNQLVSYSIKNRVISLYTSFLALEPNDTIKACKDCFDETQLTNIKAVKEAQKDTLVMQAFPNPFNSQTIIKIQLPQIFDQTNVTMRIYNVLGEAVRTFDLKDLGSGRALQLNWNGRDDNGQNVSSGIYFFVIGTQNSRQSLKLLLMK